MFMKIMKNALEDVESGDKSSGEILNLSYQVAEIICNACYSLYEGDMKKDILENLRLIFLKNVIVKLGYKKRIDLLKKYSDLFNKDVCAVNSKDYCNNNELYNKVYNNLFLADKYGELSPEVTIFLLENYGFEFFISCFSINAIGDLLKDIASNQMHSDNVDSQIKIMGVDVTLSHNLRNLYNEAISQNKEHLFLLFISKLVRNLIDYSKTTDNDFTNLKSILSCDSKYFLSKIVDINEDELEKELKDLYKKSEFGKDREVNFYRMMNLYVLLKFEDVLHEIAPYTTLEAKNKEINDDSSQQLILSLFDTPIGEHLDSKDLVNLVLASSEESFSYKVQKIISVTSGVNSIYNTLNKS